VLASQQKDEVMINIDKDVEQVAPVDNHGSWVDRGSMQSRTTTQSFAEKTIAFRHPPTSHQLKAVAKILEKDPLNPCKGGKYSTGTVKVKKIDGVCVTFQAEQWIVCD